MRLFLALVASSVVFVAAAIEPPKAPPAPATPPAKEEPATQPPAAPPGDQPRADASKPADAAKPAEAPAADDDEELPPLPADTVPSGPPPQRFNPSEKVRADFPVSFPIDI